MARILLVEDEENIGQGLVFNLKMQGHEVTWCDNGYDALDRLEAERDAIDLMILDVMMEGIDGFEVARRTRAAENYVPILMLTARDLVEDRVQGLTAGADDYLVKPFALEELLARVTVLLRRRRWLAQSAESRVTAVEVLSFGENRVDFRTHEAVGPAGALQLTAMEMAVLRYLSNHPGEVVSRGELLEKVWGVSADVTTRTVDNFLVRLRRHFEPDPRAPIYFRSVRGVGYQFMPDPSADP